MNKLFYNKNLLHDFSLKLNVKTVYDIPLFDKIMMNNANNILNSRQHYSTLHFWFMLLITANKPKFLKTKRAISNFKIKIGEASGSKSILRQQNIFQELYFFNKYIKLERFNIFGNVSFPGWSQTGNMNLGIPDIKLYSSVKELASVYSFYRNGLSYSINLRNTSFSHNKYERYYKKILFFSLMLQRPPQLEL